jgi:hypothetical protein
MFIKLICVPCVLFPIDDFPEPNQPKKKKKKKKKMQNVLGAYHVFLLIKSNKVYHLMAHLDDILD